MVEYCGYSKLGRLSVTYSTSESSRVKIGAECISEAGRGDDETRVEEWRYGLEESVWEMLEIKLEERACRIGGRTV